MDLLIKKKKGFFSKLKSFFINQPINDEMYEELEEMLIQSDISFDMTLNIVEELESILKKNKIKDSSKVYDILKEIMVNKINFVNDNETYLLNASKDKPIILFVMGVNGVGKTTSIAKISNYLKEKGKDVIVAAADTFRAAAIEQIEEWCNKNDIDLVAKTQGSDPASVIFDCMQKLKTKKYDVAIIDTAGRLQNKVNLMKELEKMYKIVNNYENDKQIECLIVLDSTTGQNAIEQAKIFNQVANISGIILTKFDGSAKGGVVFSVIDLLKKPIRFVGVGEKINDIEIFDNKKFVNSFFENNES